MECGEQCAMTSGAGKMLVWFVGSLDLAQGVSLKPQSQSLLPPSLSLSSPPPPRFETQHG